MRATLCLVLIAAACESEPSGEYDSRASTCSEVRADILDECESVYDWLSECDCYGDECADPPCTTEENNRRYDAYRECAGNLGAFDVYNATGDFSAYDVVGYCDRDSPSGDRWCPIAEAGCELP